MLEHIFSLVFGNIAMVWSLILSLHLVMMVCSVVIRLLLFLWWFRDLIFRMLLTVMLNCLRGLQFIFPLIKFV